MKKNNRQNKYKIYINFDKGNSIISISLKSSYICSCNFKDDIKINSDKIIINAFRSSKIDLKEIFYNHTSSMYIQILKSIIYYYLNSKKYVKIQSINILRYRGNTKKEKESFKLKSSEFNQILSSKFKIQKFVKSNKLLKLFDNDKKGVALLIASSYLTKALSIEDEIEVFEKLWKAFNRIYKHIGNNKNEFECQVELRNFILENPSNFPLSIERVEKVTSTEIRNKLRWRSLILNDYSTENKTKAFHNFLLRYSDKRIIELFKQILPYREEYLKNKSLYIPTIEYIENKINQNYKKDEELVVLLCIKYMYFVRNKLMHGEKLDSTFRFLQNKEIEEIKWLNDILKLLIIDLINCNDNF